MTRRFCVAKLGDEPDRDAVTVVDRSGEAIAGDKFGSRSDGGGCDEGVVRAAAGHLMLRQAEQKAPVSRCVQAKKRLGEPAPDEVPNDATGAVMRRRQSREQRVGFQRSMFDQTHAAIEHAAGRLMMFVPGCERRDDQTCVCRLHQRTRSSVSRTCSAISGGRSVSGTATTPLPRLFSVMVVAASSISSRPSPARISSTWPG